MSSKQLKSLLIAGIVVGVLSGIYMVNVGRLQSGTRTDRSHSASRSHNIEIMQALPHEKKPVPYHTEAERQAWIERNQLFAKLWLARNDRKVTQEILPFLNDPDPELRERAARALGRLEDPQAQAMLQAKLEEVRKARTLQGSKSLRGIALQTLRLAIGRIRARDLTGEAKLDKVAESVDLTYEGVVQLTQQLEAKYKSKNPDERHEAAQSPAKEIALEFVDLLYKMGKQGENIKALGAMRLAFGPAIEMRLQGATLPLDQEIQLILDYASQPKGGAFDESYLVGLGPRATEMILQRLQQMHQSPQKYNLGTPGALGHSYLFRAAAMTGDSRIISPLKQIEDDFKHGFVEWQNTPKKSLQAWTPAVQIYSSAHQSRQFAEQKSIFPRFPAY